MSEFNFIRLSLDVSHPDVIDAFSRLYCALELNLDSLPESSELEVTGTVAYAPSIGVTGETEFKIKYAEHELSFTSFGEAQDHGYKGSISSNWLEAKTSDFILSIALCDNPDLKVHIYSFDRYDLILDLVRNFGAKILKKYYSVDSSNFKLAASISKPEVADKIVSKPEVDTNEVITEKEPEQVRVEDVHVPFIADNLIQRISISEFLGFELYALVENRMDDFLSAFGITEHPVRKEQLKHDENGVYEKTLKSRSFEVKMNLVLNRDPEVKSAELLMQFSLFSVHSYLPIHFEFKAYHSDPGEYNLNTVDVLVPQSLLVSGMGERIAKDLKTFLLLAKM